MYENQETLEKLASEALKKNQTEGLVAIDWTSFHALVAALGMIIFCIIMTVIAVRLIKANISPDAVLRIVGLPFVVTIAFLLIVLGYSDKQTAPVMGLLGTVVGYLLKDVGVRRGEANAVEESS